MNREFVNQLNNALGNFPNVWIVTVVHTSGSTPRKVGAKMIVSSNGKLLNGTIGGGAIERIACKQCTSLKESKLISYDIGEQDGSVSETHNPTGMICGGNMTLFYEPIGSLNSPSVYIYGAGHCGKAVYDLLIKQDWNIIILDNRKEVLTKDRFPKAERRLGHYEELADNTSYLDTDYVLIMTQGHASDEYILKTVLKAPNSSTITYIGMMGSKRKVEDKMNRLRAEGFSHELLNRINAPIGLLLGGQSPEEIAIDIVAKLMQVRYSTTNSLAKE